MAKQDRPLHQIPVGKLAEDDTAVVLYFSQSDRTNLADKIEEYWVGKKNSPIGIQYLTFKDGKVNVGRFYERQDVLDVQCFHPGCNAFIDVNGDANIQPWGTYGKDGAARKNAAKKIPPGLVEMMQGACKLWFSRNHEFVERQARFFAERPWEQVDGMTPDDAVAKLRELGW